jgi:hypothetical protein
MYIHVYMYVCIYNNITHVYNYVIFCNTMKADHELVGPHDAVRL